MKIIASRANASFKALRALATDSRQARRCGQAWLDGAHLVSTYCQRIGPPRQLVLAASVADGVEARRLRAACAAAEVVVLTDALFAQLSALASPSGIAAVIDLPPTSEPASGAKVSRIGTASGGGLLLDAIQDAGNVGTLLRSAAAAGIGEVWLGPGCASVWSSKVLRAAQGAHFALRLHEAADLAPLLRDFAGPSVAAVAHGGRSLYTLDLRAPAILWLFGNEGQGPAPELLHLVRERVTIPLAAGAESLNVAAAAAVCLFEARRQALLAA